jgi:hypothetical protein
MQQNGRLIISEDKVLSRRDYQEILLARMAGGDLYANEERLRIRQVDMMLDKLREACGEKVLYGITPTSKD